MIRFKKHIRPEAKRKAKWLIEEYGIDDAGGIIHLRIFCDSDTQELNAQDIIDRDGLPIASIMATEEEEVISAVTSSFDIFIDRMKQEFSGESFINIMSMGNRKFYFASAGENSILTIVGEEEAKDTQLKVFGNFAIGKIKAIFERKENTDVWKRKPLIDRRDHEILARGTKSSLSKRYNRLIKYQEKHYLMLKNFKEDLKLPSKEEIIKIRTQRKKDGTHYVLT